MISEAYVATLTVADLKKLFSEVLEEFEPSRGAETRTDKLLTKEEICERLSIKNPTFNLYIEPLSDFGLFQVGGKGSTYRMKESDFNAYIESRRKK